ncbi:sulfotransferase domain-containing protein [Rhodobacter capsulatus]|uniref:sulfotransferase domain-containing protein n=1 Tax=Rhodobacter capsulatus TaxID=1061 RepID=UPI00146B06AA|nr:sulfotransferase domain-containing protein [Rhodobacter capsulatus]
MTDRETLQDRPPPLPSPRPERRVDFFILGVQKGGTTALDAMLRRHPAIQMAHRKEVHFFDDEDLDWTRPDPAGLHDLFDWSSDTVLRGEATPIYIYWPQAIERLAAYNPRARLVICLRHPAFRAYSHWRMETAQQHDTLPFSRAIRAGRDRVALAPDGVHRVFSYVERGFYAAQIARLLTHFPRRQLLFLRTDRLWAQPETELARLLDFLQLPPAQIALRDYIVPIVSTETTPMAAADHAYLCGLYDSDIRATSQITGLDLGDWLDPGYAEPMAG